MSDLTGIYDAWAAVVITAASKTPTAYNCDELPSSIQTAHLPCRLLLPFDEEADGVEFPALSLAGGLSAVWTLTELTLWEAVGQTTGIAQMGGELVQYAEAYANAIRDNRRLVRASPNATIEGARLERGVYSWGGGTAQFYGLKATLTIREIGS
jgi:hypothetical protein